MSQNDFYPKPGVRDWVLFFIGLCFVAIGIGMLFARQYQLAIGNIAFFGSCLVIQAIALWRKFRFRRPPPLKVQLTGGVPIRPSKSVVLITGIWLAALGTITIITGSSFGLLYIFCACVIALAGYSILIGVLVGSLPARYLVFDPEGMTVGSRHWSYKVKWDNIEGLAPVIEFDNPMLYVRFHRPDLVEVTPPEREESIHRSLMRRAARGRPHLELQPNQYGLDLPLFLQAIDRYIRDPDARLELAPLHALT